jgi:2'-hydroxyisoflavone reductase
VPRIVRESAEKLAGSVGHYTFISSISVYTNPVPAGADESAPVGTLEDETVEEVDGDTYGPLKALCEAAAEATLPGRTLNVRPGLIVGPHDPTDRFTYWVVRPTRGGEMLVPERLDAPVQIIDVRDLAAWIVRLVEKGQTGVLNATGPRKPIPFGDMLEACQDASNASIPQTRISDDFMDAQELSTWADLPLYLPAGYEGMLQISVDKAIKSGLTFRPLPETIRDTLAWANTRPADHEWRAGLPPERESAALQAWHALKAASD